MERRIVILTLEYSHINGQSLWSVGNNIRRILEEDMPYVKIINIRDKPIELSNPKFNATHCSQCGGDFGPGNSGYSHCIDHRGIPEKYED